MRTSVQDQFESEIVPQDAWREQFLQRILIFSAVIGLFALIPAVISTSDLILQSTYIGVYVLLVAVVIIRLPYNVKAMLFVLLPLILGFGSLTETGIRGDSLFFFLAFVTFATLLLSPRTGVISIAVTEIIIFGMGYLVLNGNFRLSEKLALGGDLSDWGSAAISQLLISIVILYALHMLDKNFREAQGQLIALNKSQLMSPKDLEKRIAERTQELERKTNLLNAASIVTHQTAILQDLDRLLNRTASLISEHFACYHVGVYLVNQREDYVTLQATSSKEGKKLLEQGYRLRIGAEGIIGYVAAEKKPRISLDAEKDIVLFNSPELAETRSELALPLIAHNRIVGVLDLQSTEVSAFSYDEIEIFQSMADQIAIAIENTRLLNENQLVISQLEIISNEHTRQNWKSKIAGQKQIVQYTATGIHQAEKSSTKGKNILDIPVMLRGQKIGSITLQRKAEFQKWTAQEESIASEVATQTALALENVRLIESTRERVNREQVISNISNRVRETLDLDIVLRTCAREIQRTLNLQEAEVRLLPQISISNEQSQ
jgi:GAF domain-containing protein